MSGGSAWSCGEACAAQLIAPPLAAQTESPGTFVHGTAGHVNEEQCMCMVVVHGFVVGCKQQSPADGARGRLYTCGRLTHPTWQELHIHCGQAAASN